MGDSPHENESGALYGAPYYRTSFGAVPYERNSHWLGFFSDIADRIVRALHPETVFDAGCAWGFLVEALCDRGVRAQGRDISEYAIGKVREDIRFQCAAGSLVDPIAGRYDLVVCIEVLEHMPEEQALRAIRQITAVTDAVLFSSAQGACAEPSLVKVQPVLYWLRVFAECGFGPDEAFDGSFMAAHAFLVRRRAEPTPDETLLAFADTLRLRGDRVAFLNRHLRIEELEDENLRLRQSIEHLTQTQLESFRSSPAGRIILRYREWFRRNRRRRRWIQRFWEPSALWILRRLDKSAAAQPASGRAANPNSSAL
jgi:hypothetical protein